jgi:hypothetical protein
MFSSAPDRYATRIAHSSHPEDKVERNWDEEGDQVSKYGLVDVDPRA